MEVPRGQGPELYFGLLLPFKNHEDGLKAFSFAVNTYTSEPAPKHFTEALANVIADKQCEPPQKDPLGIIPACKAYDAVRPLIFTKKAVPTTMELALKFAVDKRFITYMQVCFFFDLAIVDCRGNDCCDNAMQVQEIYQSSNFVIRIWLFLLILSMG